MNSSNVSASAGLLACTLTLFSICGCALPKKETAPAFLKDRTFFASFDSGPDADFAAGDNRLYHAPTMKHPRTGEPGLPKSGVVTLEPSQGKRGGALRFHKKTQEMVFFKALKNVPYQTNDWQGTVSFWLSLNPEEDLEPGYCDPIQITPREWNDAAFFVEFGKDENPRHFRLGVYADFKTWNPANRDWNKIPMAEKPLLSVTRHPFQRGKWTHVLFTFKHFNTRERNGVAELYLNGKSQGVLGPLEQTFTWDPEKALMMLGLSYIGLYDELSVFNRALSADEVEALYRLGDKP